jgi:hypothetical protein
MKIRIFVLVLIAGLLTACGSQPAATPASPSTDEPVQPTQAPTNPPASTDTAVSAPEPTPEQPVSGTTISFATDILPIIERRCRNCHGGNRTEEGLVLLTYADIMAGSDNGLVVTPGDAGNSLLAEMLLNNKMPKRGPKLTPEQVQLIVDWINQGALNN